MACYPWFFAGLKARLERRLGSNDELCVGRSFKEDEVDLLWFVVLWRGFDIFTQMLDANEGTDGVKEHLGWWERTGRVTAIKICCESL